ncbi:RNA ligase/cyclic nucleotide phosphodiesterase [Macrophomina phaseolina]|uniref:RNA ligase/cyclic nucleotide phosphodiesterase n=1 Tax=Macrophomina phaseolina TaxID=35725 RepID=A0ABQ8GK75_9PEZI|nr:RNA ligase/cyclic nucleotide phosphodiesterase [Macrophomina phaseolina]
METPHAPARTVTPAYDDFSGIDMTAFANPYDALIAASKDDPKQIQSRYSTHREARNAAQKEKLLAPDFSGVMIDPILLRLEDPSIEPGFVDTRNCLVFWARPPDKVKALVKACQEKLKAVVPNLWLMPPNSLHMTALEITHSRTPAEIDALVANLAPSIPSIVHHTNSSPSHRARVVRPLLGFDASAIALSFVPAVSGEGLVDGKDLGGRERQAGDDAYTYHHLRRDLFAKATEAGVKVDSRYVVPSAHLTVARFIREEDFWVEGERGVVDARKVRRLVERIEEVNEWLRREFWPNEGGRIKEGGEWVVGEGKGLDFRRGTLWYGSGGETVTLGEGF